MIAIFSRKKICEDKLANILVNSLLKLSDEGFSEIAATINEDPSFISPPNVSSTLDREFLLIVVTGNLKQLQKRLANGQDQRVRSLVISKLADVFNIPDLQLESQISELSGFMKRVNHPSKNTLYAMNKALFYKYDLNGYQDDYFKNMNSPNPLFLSRINDLMQFFLWDWDKFFADHKVTH